MALTKAEVLTAALQIVDEYGLADLTMRRLATHLDVQAGALYYHVANKQTLLVELADLTLADLVLADLVLDDPPAQRPGVDAVAWGMRLHELLRSHRSGAELVSAALAMRSIEASPAAALATAMRASHGDEAPAIAHAVLSLVIGHTLDEEQRDQFARLGLGAPPDPEGTDRLRLALTRLVGE